MCHSKVIYMAALLLLLCICGSCSNQSSSQVSTKAASIQNVEAGDQSISSNNILSSAKISESEKKALAEAAGAAEMPSGFASYQVENGILYADGKIVDTGVTTLDLSDTKFDDYTFLSDFINIETLLLSGSTIKDLTPIASCVHLKKLVLNGCNKVSDLTPLSNLDALEALFLTSIDCGLDLSPLSTLTELKTLQLNFSQVTDISPLSSLSQLCYLGLWATPVTDFSSIEAMTSLTELCVSNTSFSDLSVISGHSKLEILDISHTAVVDYSVLLEENFLVLREMYCDAEGDTLSALIEAYPNCLIE